jgi:hypothetical protein
MLTKIASMEPPCLHPEHNPPNMIVLSPGTYEHKCPGCGKKMSFIVSGPIWSIEPRNLNIVPDGHWTNIGPSWN